MVELEPTPSPQPLCVLSVHAHPDDEASKGAPTMAKYAADGVRTVLVTCTGGEAGDLLNPEADTPEARADIGAVRLRELEESVRIIGYSALHLLGYRDSGMPDSEANAHPDNFANADLDEAVGRLVAIVRAERPQVIVTYGDGRGGGYEHPDHIRVHDVSVLAFERAGDPDWYQEHGEPWQPLKLYYSSGFSRRRVRAMHEWFETRGEESPFKEWVSRMPNDTPDTTTTRIDIGEYLHVGREALLAHRTQVAPTGFFFSVPTETMREIHPWEDFDLARSLVETGVADGEYEHDLFQGVRITTGS
ncbi:MAG: mycothiol conjugate amidase Mca [Acidimicrobiia bacterium]